MLVELTVENLALLERAGLVFGAGLNAITGETGAGKSLLLDALEFLLGQKPRAGMLRSGAKEARVTGRFAVHTEKAGRVLGDWLARNAPGALEEAAEDPELELVLSRTLSAASRTRAYVNLRPVTQKALRELASLLVEIHGQNEHQKLLEAEEQRRLLDAFGELDTDLDDYRAKRTHWLEVNESLRSFDEDRAERLDRLDLVRYQASELNDAAVLEDEDLNLRAERERLRHAEELRTRIGGALQALYDADEPGIDAVRRARNATADWEERVPELRQPAEGMREALDWLEQAEGGLRDFVESIEASPERLDEVESRLVEIERLERKYRCSTNELSQRAAELALELEGLEGEGSDRNALAEKAAKARKALVRAASKLTSARKKLRSRLQNAVKTSLVDLGLKHTDFEVRVGPRVGPRSGAVPVNGAEESDLRLFGPHGADAVEFFMSANPGEALQPLRDVASGGETARIMLALRSALALRQSIPTLVFDEVDAGVGGRLAPRVGAHLCALGERHQILCVTHLPAVAAVAHTHLKVKKAVRGKRTTTQITELEGDQRVAEVADMIAGGAEQATAQAEARRLLSVG